MENCAGAIRDAVNGATSLRKLRSNFGKEIQNAAFRQKNGISKKPQQILVLTWTAYI